MNNERFYFMTLARSSWSPKFGPTAILDTNVVSALESLAIRGYDSGLPAHLAAHSLLEWGHAVGGMRADTSLDQLEGASFHRGTVDACGLLRRTTAVQRLLQLSPDELESFIQRGEPVEASATLEMADRSWKGLELAESMMEYEFLPAYAMSLTVQHWYRHSQSIPLSEQLFRLTSEVACVPDSASIPALLIEFANKEFATSLRDGLSKVGASDARKSALSAAWDLAYLSRLHWSTTDFAGHPQDIPVLVTADGSFAQLLSSLRLSFTDGRLDVRAFAFGPGSEGFRDARLEIDRLNQDETLLDVEPAFADEVACAYRSVITRLERDLGFERTALGGVRRSVNVPLETEAVWGLLEVLLDGWAAIIDRILILFKTHDILLSFSKDGAMLLQQSADVHGEDVQATISRIYKSSGPLSRGLEEGRTLVISMALGSPVMQTALLKSFAISDNWRNAMIPIIQTIRDAVDDIAIAQCESTQSVVKTLMGNIESVES